jgi:hypothetical protein
VVRMVRLQVQSLVLKLRKMYWGAALRGRSLSLRRVIPSYDRDNMSVKKTLKQGLKPEKGNKDKVEKFNPKTAQDNALKAFKKMSGDRGEQPI